MSGRKQGQRRKDRAKEVKAKRAAWLGEPEVQEERKLSRAFRVLDKDDVPEQHPIRLTEDAPVPPRNGPCPLHPEFKLKKCPHGCLHVFQNYRSRVAGDTVLKPVSEGAVRIARDPKSGKLVEQPIAGRFAREDATNATLHDLNNVMESMKGANDNGD